MFGKRINITTIALGENFVTEGIEIALKVEHKPFAGLITI